MTSASSPEPGGGAPTSEDPTPENPTPENPTPENPVAESPASGSAPTGSAPTGSAPAGPARPEIDPGSPAARLRRRIRSIPDFPRPGVLFRDLFPLLRDPDDFAAAVEALSLPFVGREIALVAGIESRGFLLAGPVASRLGAGLTPLRKPGKLPGETIRRAYRLEYGESALEMQVDAVGPGERVLLVDDVLATGGSAAAASALLRAQGARVVGCSFLIELRALGGREHLRADRAPRDPAGPAIHTVLRYP